MKLTAICLLSVGLIVYLPGCALKPSSRDSAEALRLRVCVIDNYPFPAKSKVEPELPPVNGGAGVSLLLFYSPPHHLVVYGITNAQDQETILDIVRGCRKENHISRSTIVEFYREENWTVKIWQNGDTGGFRGKEERIRKVYLW